MPKARQPLCDKQRVEGLPKVTAELSGLLSTTLELGRGSLLQNDKFKVAYLDKISTSLQTLSAAIGHNDTHTNKKDF